MRDFLAGMIMENALIALISALTTAVYFIYTSHVMKHDKGISSMVTLTVGHLVGGSALLPVWYFMMPTEHYSLALPKIFIPFAAIGVLLVMSRQLYFYAYAHTDVANITVFSALTPIYAMVIAFVTLGEVPRLVPFFGMLIITGSIYALFMKRDPAVALAQNIVQPFTRIAASRPILCAFLSTIPTAFAATVQKRLMATLDPVTFTMYLLFIIGLLSLVIFMSVYSAGALVAQVRRLPLGYLVASATLLPLMHILFCLVIKEQQTAISLVLQRSSIMFQVILAYLFLRERQDMKKRLIVTACIIVGFLMIVRG